LQRFGTRAAATDAPEVTFPPDGARLSSAGATLMVKLRGGVRPFVLLSNGLPVATDVRASAVEIPHPGTGYSTLTVVDAQGQSSGVTIRMLD